MVTSTNRTDPTTTQTHNFNIAPALLANKVEDKGEFVLIRRGYGSEQPQVWSTGDKDVAEQLIRQAMSELQPA